jgi:hypothetical protein
VATASEVVVIESGEVAGLTVIESAAVALPAELLAVTV